MAEPTDNRKAPPHGIRRRLVKGGLGAAPVLMTLVSRPVLGDSRCFTPSGFHSMPTSDHGPSQFCAGRTPGFWKQEQKFSEWPAPYFPTTVTGPGGHEAARFNAVLGAPSPYTDTATFVDVLRTDDPGFSGPPHDVARHVVAALLNVAKGWTPVLSEQLVKRIWSEYWGTGGGTVGFFEPTAGVRWSHEQIAFYLISTQIG
jgi:hypothetical protein